jgi:hypothetical protein
MPARERHAATLLNSKATSRSFDQVNSIEQQQQLAPNGPVDHKLTRLFEWLIDDVALMTY